MTESMTLLAIQQHLADLEAISFVAHRDVRIALPQVEKAGEAVTLEWIKTCRILFEHDRDAGKAFIRGSQQAAEACPAILTWTQVALRFTAWRGSWKAMNGFMEQLPAACALLGAEGVARWSELGLAWCDRHLDSGVAYFNCPVARFAGSLGVAGIEELVLPSVELFASRRLALGSYLHGALRVRDLLGIAAVAQWAKRGADILQAGRLRGEAFFRLESEESIAILLEQVSGFRLDAHHRLYQLILRAWFDDGLDILDSNWSPDQGRAFVETDGRALYLPRAMPDTETAMLSVLHAAGHVFCHSYEQADIEALFRAAGMQHPPLDEEQRITWRPLFAAFGADMVRFQLIFDICEDLRVDASLARRIPNYIQRLLRATDIQQMPDGAPGAYYAWAQRTLYWLAGGAPVDETLEFLRVLLQPDATVLEAWQIATAWYTRVLANEAGAAALPPITLAERADAYLPGRSPNAARPVYPRHSRDAKGQSDADATDSVAGEQELKPPAQTAHLPQQAAGEDPDMDIPPEDTAGSGGRVGVGIPQPAHVQGQARGPEYSEKGKPYAEWDYRDQRYKPQWAWVQEKLLTETDESEAARLMERYAAVLKRLKRAISAQKPTRMAPKRRQFEGEELDLDATITWSVERRSGMAPKSNIYRQRRVQHRDTAVTLLADLSTSIMQTSPHGGRVVDRIRAGMLLFAESLEAMGDTYSMAGFASKYRDGVSYYTIKSFDERLNSHSRAILGGLSGRLATRMGAAIRHAQSGFDAVPSSRRLLLILSDGRPADYDDGGDERYLQEDTRMAVKEALDCGVHPFCVTLDVAGSAYLPQIFGEGHYTILDRIDDLPKKLPEIYLRLRR